ncbi:MAG: exonuclease SbcCD subunit D [Chloroflexota bacterium]|jgi:exonuclease SbcD
MKSNQSPIRILHFADAHIDIANYGRHDPVTALPVRVMDFLASLDQIVDRAIEEQVDLVLFAGDAYKDRNPQPTFQREWGQRMMRLSQAGIPTLLLVGNHDVSPTAGRAHTLQEYSTLEVPNLHVASRIELLGPEILEINLQVITVPWVSRSALMTREDIAGRKVEEILHILEGRVGEAIEKLIAQAKPDIPLVLSAHAGVQGARYGSERAVMLGHDLVLGGAIVADKRLDYVALGHIHKHQSLNDGRHPPIVYPGSIERIDFGEAKEQKGFVLAEVGRGHTDWRFVPLKTRPFIDIKIETPSAETFMEDVLEQLPDREQVKGAICRVQLSYPRDWEPLVDEKAIGDRFSDALSFQILKHRQTGDRSRLGDLVAVETLTHQQLLDQYWSNIGLEEKEREAMRLLAKEVLTDQIG